MKKKILEHFCVIAAGLLVLFGIPLIRYSDRLIALLGKDPDAVTGATMLIPDQPSGEFVVLLNRQKHAETLAEWTDFFLEKPVDVIFEDLDCIVIDADVSGIQLAERYQARLAENQMMISRQNGLLAVSKAQWGDYDVLILSKEFADVYTLSTVCEREETMVIIVTGEGI